MKIIIIYLICMNLLGLFSMYYDKKQSIKKKYRIPEKQLFLVSMLGGSLGTWCGMYLFHHKTKHWYFVVGMPVIFFLHCILLYFVLFPLLRNFHF